MGGEEDGQQGRGLTGRPQQKDGVIAGHAHPPQIRLSETVLVLDRPRARWGVLRIDESRSELLHDGQVFGFDVHVNQGACIFGCRIVERPFDRIERRMTLGQLDGGFARRGCDCQETDFPNLERLQVDEVLKSHDRVQGPPLGVLHGFGRSCWGAQAFMTPDEGAPVGFEAGIANRSPAIDRKMKEHRRRVLWRARAALEQQTTKRWDMLALDKQFAECRVPLVLERLAEHDLGIGRHAKLAVTGTLVDEPQAPHLDVASGKNANLETRYNALIAPANYCLVRMACDLVLFRFGPGWFERRRP